MFWINCGCSGVGEGVLGVGAVVQVKVRVFWRGSGCSGVIVSVLEKVQVFWSGYGCSG